ncbi:MAG: MBG domain-containing protein [Bacteroidota bacterium]
MKNISASVALLLAVSQCLSGQAGSDNTIINNNVFLKGQYVEVGIAACGVFGTTEAQPAGYHGNVGGRLGFVADPDKNGWSTGFPAYNGDYFLPGSPEEGFGIEVGGHNYGNFSQCGVYQIPMSSVSTRMENTQHVAEWNGSVAGIDIKQAVTFEDDETYFFISAELTNTTGSEIYNTYYMRNVDPDNERMWPGGSYTTINSIVYQPGSDPCDRALVSATGQAYGMYLGLAAVDPRARVTHGGFSNRDASNIYTGTGLYQSGTRTADEAISIAFKIDTIGPGETVTVYYAYILDQSQVSAAIGNLTRLLANGNDITTTLVHASCQEPVLLEIVNAEAFNWVWSPPTYLSTNSGTTVICTAPPGTYTYSAVGTNACGSTITYNFDLQIAADAELPVISCIPDTVAGECDNPLILASPLATDNCNVKSLTHDSPYGASTTDASGTYPAGIHTIQWTAEDYAGNSSFCNQTVEVISAPGAPSGSDVVYTYGENVLVTATPAVNHTIHWYMNADLSDVPVSSSTLNLGILNAGSYTRYATQVTDATSCESAATTVQITINTAVLEITADNKNRIYGAADPSLTWQISSGALVGVDAVSGSAVRVPGEVPGDYPIEQGTLSAGSNYNLSFIDGTLTIAVAPLEVTGDSLSKTYGTADPPLTYAITGGALVGGDLITGSLTRAAGEDAGSYAIEQGTLSAGSNYALTFADGTLTIVSADLEVSADNQTKIYGDGDPALTWQVSSGALVGDDTLTGVLMRVPGEDVGNYAIEQGTLSADANYNLTFVAGSLAISQTPLVVSADSLSKTYGTADPQFTYTITGGALVGGDLITGSLTRAAGEDAASYAVEQGTLSAGTNYAMTFINGWLSVNPAEIGITADDKSRIYGEIDPSFTWQISSGALVGSDAVSGSPVRVPGEDTGDYPIRQGTVDAGSNYTLSFIEGTMTITTAPLEVTGDSLSKIYGAADPPLTYTITGGALVGGDLITGSLTRGSGEDAGYYAIEQGTLSAGSNYALTFVDGTLTIVIAEIEVSADNQTKNYGDGDPALSWQISSGALVGDDSLTGVLIRVPGEDVGYYAIEQGTLTAAANYNLTFVAGSLAISQAPLEVSADSLSKTYGMADPPLTYTISVGVLVGGDLITGSLTRAAGEDAGSYAIEQGTLSAGSNYALTFVDGTLTISTAVLEITADNKNRIYGAADPSLTWQISSGALVGSDTVSGSPLRIPGEDPGDYPIQQGTLSAGSNYILTFAEGTLTIAAAPLEVTAGSLSKTYGDADPPLTYTITGGALVGGDLITGSVARVTGEDVGSYAIEQGTLTAGPNYAIAFVDGILVISQDTLEISAEDLNKVFGEADPSLTFVVTNGSLVTGDTISGSPAREPGEDAGTYSIGQGSLSAGNNYLIIFTEGLLTITPADVQVVADSISKSYGEDDPPLTYTIVFGAPVDTALITGTPARLPGNDVGTYAIERGTLTGGGNIHLSFTGAAFTINQALLELTADDLSKSYGTDDPLLSYTITGGTLAYGDIISGTMVRNPGENTGTYTISDGDLSAGSNYIMSFVDGQFTVNKATLTVTAEDKSILYGESVPSLSYVYAGFAFGEDPTVLDTEPSIGTEANQLSEPGSYPISLSGGADNNYSFDFIEGTVTVQKVALTVVAEDQIREYGDDNPAFTSTISGFVNGEDITVLDTRPEGSTVADINSGAGTYDIIFSGGEDNKYEFSYNQGTLTIQKAVITITVEDKTIVFGEEVPELTYVATGFKNNENDEVFSVPVTIETEYTPMSDAGDYLLTGSGAMAGNYDFVYVDGTLGVGKATQVITFIDIPDGLRMTGEHKLEASSNSGLPVSFESSDSEVASISGELLVILKEGFATIRAFQEGDLNWISAEASQDITTMPTFDDVTSLFTPNGDGINDYWYIPDLEELGKVSVKVFNRYGNLVYESEQYTNNWDGTWKNKDLPEGSYYYILDTERNGLQKGVVNIVR